jgi:exodeoxyribonuclease V alpha subunit
MSSPAQDSSQPAHNSVPEFLTGVVERITYHAEKSGYTVARIKSPRARDLITIVGNFADIQAGQTLRGDKEVVM